MSKISSSDSRKLSDARAFLSAALTNKITCLEGLSSSSGPIKQSLLNSLTSTYIHVSNSLSIIPKPVSERGGNKRRLLGFPRWLSGKSRRILQSSGDEYDPGQVLTVAVDGSGNFTTVSDAINFAPNNSVDRVFINVKEGFYQENVEIPSWKINIVLLGDGSDGTVISGKRSVDDGWTTFRSATVDDLSSNSSSVESYLGRPWMNYSRTVYLESYIDDFIEPEGWTNWVGDQGLDTLYFGEYENYGPGSAIDGRVSWSGYHVMEYDDAANFTVSEFITGEEWLDSTSFPYDDGV
ncbi:hypothetical protein RD792_006037 [Penstemon davidsonii]|uniref:Pectinesterase n=1 Tax=Penstemon davidsonii TaxID=160366 RepID=A0ABR0DW78_9LAMI|nr:hypothetical protein RD792_006037 [Penstemon davidsonii]